MDEKPNFPHESDFKKPGIYILACNQCKCGLIRNLLAMNNENDCLPVYLKKTLCTHITLKFATISLQYVDVSLDFQVKACF